MRFNNFVSAEAAREVMQFLRFAIRDAALRQHHCWREERQSTTQTMSSTSAPRRSRYDSL